MFYKTFEDPVEIQDHWIIAKLKEIALDKTLDPARDLEGTAWCSKERIVIGLGKHYLSKKLNSLDSLILWTNYQNAGIINNQRNAKYPKPLPDCFYTTQKCCKLDITGELKYVEGFRAIDGVLQYWAWNSFHGAVVDHLTIFDNTPTLNHMRKFTFGKIREGVEYFGTELDTRLVKKFGTPVLARYDTCYGWPVITSLRAQL